MSKPISAEYWSVVRRFTSKKFDQVEEPVDDEHAADQAIEIEGLSEDNGEEDDEEDGQFSNNDINLQKAIRLNWIRG